MSTQASWRCAERAGVYKVLSGVLKVDESTGTEPRAREQDLAIRLLEIFDAVGVVVKALDVASVVEEHQRRTAPGVVDIKRSSWPRGSDDCVTVIAGALAAVLPRT